MTYGTLLSLICGWFSGSTRQLNSSASSFIPRAFLCLPSAEYVWATLLMAEPANQAQATRQNQQARNRTEGFTCCRVIGKDATAQFQNLFLQRKGTIVSSLIRQKVCSGRFPLHHLHFFTCFFTDSHLSLQLLIHPLFNYPDHHSIQLSEPNLFANAVMNNSAVVFFAAVACLCIHRPQHLVVLSMINDALQEAQSFLSCHCNCKLTPSLILLLSNRMQLQCTPATKSAALNSLRAHPRLYSPSAR